MTAGRDTDLGSVLVTGATGQVGRRLVAALRQEGQAVSVLTRSPEVAERLWPEGAVEIRVADLRSGSRLAGIGSGVDTVFHLASHAPRPDEPDLYNAPDHWPVTALGSANLADALRDSQVKRLVYVSTVKAMGDQVGALGSPADEDSVPAPNCLYGRAKRAAEQSLLGLGSATGMKVSVMRLPMVYGLDEKGNIARLVAAVASGRFPPWPRIANRRSAIHVEDAIAAALLMARHPATGGQTYIATDGEAYSTRWMYEQTLIALDRPIPRWSVPPWLLRRAAAGGSLAERLLGRCMPLTLEGLAKLTGDAWYSSEKLRRTLGFTPRHSLADEIPRLARRWRA
ncbi:NAD-dependent epimerase/dehydratase family protein [Thiocystis violacea]|uniref:NAD-dependent epimerase/dehydratase family protein n=1 Tax=Thiocystis violacea TaxID=13725 RepID=UPI001905A9C2|nr:NAD-dependent epimerase/dehydratase family protein [Thiocystis violacea]MBK1719972.1 epimerase [Thiocystis violacea]